MLSNALHHLEIPAWQDIEQLLCQVNTGNIWGSWENTRKKGNKKKQFGPLALGGPGAGEPSTGTNQTGACQVFDNDIFKNCYGVLGG